MAKPSPYICFSRQKGQVRSVCRTSWQGPAVVRVRTRRAQGAPKLFYGEGFDSGPPQVGAGSVSLWVSQLLVVVLGLPASFPTPLPYFRVGVLVAVFLSTETSL